MESATCIATTSSIAISSPKTFLTHSTSSRSAILAGPFTLRSSKFPLTQQTSNLLWNFGLRASWDRYRLILWLKSRYLVFGGLMLLIKHRQGSIWEQHWLELNIWQDPQGGDRLPDLPQPSDRGLHRQDPQPWSNQTHESRIGIAALVDEEVWELGREDDL